MNESRAQLIMRRLSAAEGYLQLGLPSRALEEIDAIDDIGPFAPPRDLLRGAALKELERYDEAIEFLQLAAKTVAPIHRPMAWSSLIECYRARGENDVATLLEHATRTPGDWSIQLPHGVQIAISVRPSLREGDDGFLEAGDVDEPSGEESHGHPEWN